MELIKKNAGFDSIGPDRLRELIQEVARIDPELSELSIEQMDTLSRVVLAEQLKAKLTIAIKSARINLQEEIKIFIISQRSGHTKQVYERAVNELVSYCNRQSLDLISLSPKQFDDFILWLKTDNTNQRAANSIRLIVAALSTFFTWMERRFDFIKNPVRGTKTRPKKPTREAEIPTDKEVNNFIDSQKGSLLGIAVKFCYESGARVGGLYALQVDPKTGYWFSFSKGKSIRSIDPIGSGLMADLQKIAGKSSESKFSPFKIFANDPDQLAHRLKNILRFYVKGSGLAWSFHDLRHLYAQRLLDDKFSVYEISKRLGHANISITDTYLRNQFGHEGK